MIGLLWTRDRAVADFATYTINTEGSYPFPQAGFEPRIPASERPQTHALKCAAIDISTVIIYRYTIFGKWYEK